jgi:hypothetical protein
MVTVQQSITRTRVSWKRLALTGDVKKGSPKAPLNQLSNERKLEDYLPGELDVSASVEEGRNESIRNFIVREAINDERVRVIEHVVGFEAELKVDALRDFEILVQTGIQIPEARSTESITRSHV